MAKQLKKGDKVEWGTPQGKTTGTVKKKLTSPTKIKGHEVAASKENPEYMVESGKSGEKAAHKPEALKKVSGTRSTAHKPSRTAGEGKSSKKSTKTASAGAKSTAEEKRKTSPSDASSKKSSGSKTGPKKKKVSVKPPAKTSSSSGTSASKMKSGSKSATKKAPAGVAKKTAARSSAKKSNDDDDERAIADFKKMMNISPKKLDRWLDTDESKKVGFKENDKGESVGHESGRKIIKILTKRKDRYTEEDVKHIHKVVGYVKRHLAQKPKGDISASNWRYSLMNWGHDPAK